MRSGRMGTFVQISRHLWALECLVLQKPCWKGWNKANTQTDCRADGMQYDLGRDSDSMTQIKLVGIIFRRISKEIWNKRLLHRDQTMLKLPQTLFLQRISDCNCGCWVCIIHWTEWRQCMPCYRPEALSQLLQTQHFKSEQRLGPPGFCFFFHQNMNVFP